MNSSRLLPLTLLSLLIGCVEPPGATTPTSREDTDMATLLDMTIVDMPNEDMGKMPAGDMAERPRRDAAEDMPLNTCDATTFTSTCVEGNDTEYTICENDLSTTATCAENQVCAPGDGVIQCIDPVVFCLRDQSIDCPRQDLLPTGGLLNGYGYGQKMHVSANGRELLISAPVEFIGDESTRKPSHVYHFSRPTQGDAFAYTSTVGSTRVRTMARWGGAMSTSADGKKAVVCAPLINCSPMSARCGECVVYSKVDGPSEYTELISSISSGTVVPYFGNDVHMSPDGKWVVIGARGTSPPTTPSKTGQVDIYYLTDASPEAPAQAILTNTLIPATTSLNVGNFGASLNVFWEGTGPNYTVNVVVGAPGSNASRGKVFLTRSLQLTPSEKPIFERLSPIPEITLPTSSSPMGYPIIGAGASVTFNASNTHLAISAPNSGELGGEGIRDENGAVIIYELGNMDQTILEMPDRESANETFGSSLHFDRHGLLWVGARNYESSNDMVPYNGKGRVYIYKQNMTSGGWDLLRTVEITDPTEPTKEISFGTSIQTFVQGTNAKVLIGSSFSSVHDEVKGNVTLFDLGPEADLLELLSQ